MFMKSLVYQLQHAFKICGFDSNYQSSQFYLWAFSVIFLLIDLVKVQCTSLFLSAKKTFQLIYVQFMDDAPFLCKVLGIILTGRHTLKD